MLKLSLLQSTPTYLVAITMFALIIISYWIGHRLRSKAIKNNPDEASVDFGSINSILLGLLGLLLAFTFSMSNSRFDARRQLVIEEANAIGTAILRTDVYPDSVRQLLRQNLKEYVEARIAFYEVGMNAEKIVEYYVKADRLGKKVWSIAAEYAKKDQSTTIASQLIPALNDMIDITTTRRAAGESTIPDSILYFLFILCLSSGFLLGYDHKTSIDWVIVLGFAIMLSATLFTIIDMDRPRSGLINMDTPNQKIVELREMFAHDSN
jgi:uncharacterized membrane protein (DUF485 family)